MRVAVPFLFLLFFVAAQVNAQQTFTAINNGNWSNENTWNPTGVPGDRDVAVIESSRTVTLDGDVTIEGLAFTGGTLQGSGELTITEFFNWSGGNLGGDVDEVAIHVILPEESESTWDGGSKNLNARVDNEGSISWREGNISTRSTGLGIINNEGTFVANASANANFIRFINLPGAEVVKSTSSSTIFSSGLFENHGEVDLRAGTLDIRGSASLPAPIDSGTYLTESGTELIFSNVNRSFDETATIQSNSQVTFQAGIVLIKGSYQSPNTRINSGTLEFDTGSLLELPQLTINGGTITGSDEIRLTGDSEWIAGATLSNEGIIIAEGVTFTITGSGPKQLNTSLTNFGTIDWTDGNWSTSTAGLGTVFNNSPGQINITGNGNMNFLDVRNFATIIRSGSTGEASIVSGFFQNENNGTVEVNSGTLRIGGSTTMATPSDEGDYQIASGATLRLQHTRELSSGSSVTGNRLLINGSISISGSLDVSTVDVSGTSANLTLSGSSTFSIPELNMDGNTLTSIIPLTVTDAMTWTRGTIEGPGIITISGTSSLSISGTANRNLNGTIENEAVTTWSGGRINSSTTGGGEFINNGEFRIETDEEFSRAIFTNNRVLRKTSSGQSGFTITQFVNSGDVEIESGTLRLNTTPALSIPVDDGVYTLAEGTGLIVDGSPRRLSSDGEIRGPGTITASSSNLIDNRGIHSPGNSTGVMTYEGEFSMDASSAEINIVLNGTTPGSGHDQLQITESAFFNQGTLQVELASGYSPSVGDEFEIITYGNHEGEFDSIELPGLNGGLEFNLAFRDDGLFLGVFDPSPNAPPFFTNTFDEETINEGEAFSFQFEAVDPDGDDLTFSLTEGNDVENASITSEGLFTFNPEAGQAGSYDFTVRVSDGSLFDEHDFVVIVEAANQPPVFESNPVTIAQVGEPYVYNIETSDPDGDPVTVSAITIPDWLTFTADDGGTGVLEGTPLASDIGDHEVVLQASDGEDTTNQMFTIEVRDAPNEPPLFTTTFDEETIAEGDEFFFQFEAEDPDDDELTFSLTEGNDVENASITAGGLFTFNPESGQAGSYDFTVRVSDGELSDEHDFVVNVEADNQPPVFESDPVTIAQVGEPYVYTIETSDPDGDPVTVTAITVPDWLTFSADDGGTGVLEGTPLASDIGEHEVVLQANDGESTTNQEFTIEVREEPNEPPFFTSTFDEETITEGDEFFFQFEAEDPDDDELTFSLTEGNDVENSSITANGLFEFNPQSGQAGSFDYTVRVSDGELFDEHDFVVIVEAANQPPVFESDPVTIAQVGAPYEYNIETSDPDGDDIILSVPTLPDWLSFTDNGDGTGLLSGTPAESDIGDHDVVLQVSDGEDTITQEFTIDVREAPNEPPVITTTFDEETITEGDEFSFQFEAEDPDDDELTFSLTEGDDVENASITANGLFAFNPQPAQAGSYDFTVRVSDGELFDEHNFVVIVEAAANQPPVFESDPVTMATANQLYQYEVVATDPDGDSLTLTASPLPGWLSFADNGDGTGVLQGIPGNEDVGNQNVVLQASDGENTVVQEFTIQVQDDTDDVVTRFEITDLGHLGGGSSMARDINGNGIIVGASVTATGETAGFVWQEGVMSTPSIAGQTHFYSISGNSIAGIVGSGEAIQAMRTTPDLSSVEIVGPSDGYTVAYGVNSNWLVGVQKNSAGQYVAARMSPETTQLLSLMESDMSVAFHISSNGRVAGTLFTAGGEARGFVDEATGPENSRFYTVSSNGTAAGSIAGSPASWQAGSDPQIFEGNGEIYARNQSGWAVGVVNNGASKESSTPVRRFLDESPWIGDQTIASKTLDTYRAALWKNGELNDLNEMLLGGENWLLLEASGLNESGQITGTGLLNGELRAFLLNPVQAAPDADTNDLFSDAALEAGVHLHQNYPNPFNPSTQFVFELTEADGIVLQIFDMLGRLVATVADGRMDAGTHTIHFDAGHLSSGIYIYTIRTRQTIQTRKMTLMK